MLNVEKIILSAHYPKATIMDITVNKINQNRLLYKVIYPSRNYFQNMEMNKSDFIIYAIRIFHISRKQAAIIWNNYIKEKTEWSKPLRKQIKNDLKTIYEHTEEFINSTPN